MVLYIIIQQWKWLSKGKKSSKSNLLFVWWVIDWSTRDGLFIFCLCVHSHWAPATAVYGRVGPPLGFCTPRTGFFQRSHGLRAWNQLVSQVRLELTGAAPGPESDLSTGRQCEGWTEPVPPRSMTEARTVLLAIRGGAHSLNQVDGRTRPWF
jgi:hypothetical protein